MGPGWEGTPWELAPVQVVWDYWDARVRKMPSCATSFALWRGLEGVCDKRCVCVWREGGSVHAWVRSETFLLPPCRVVCFKGAVRAGAKTRHAPLSSTLLVPGSPPPLTPPPLAGSVTARAGVGVGEGSDTGIAGSFQNKKPFRAKISIFKKN